MARKRYIRGRPVPDTLITRLHEWMQAHPGEFRPADVADQAAVLHPLSGDPRDWYRALADALIRELKDAALIEVSTGPDDPADKPIMYRPTPSARQVA